MSLCTPPACTYLRSTDVEEERLDDELILLHRKSLQVRVLNNTATVLWDAMAIYHGAQELADLMIEAWPAMEPAEAVGYAHQFLDSLVAVGFVIRGDVPTDTKPSAGPLE